MLCYAINLEEIVMKIIKCWKPAFVILLCLLMLFSMSSCRADREIGNNTELGEQFLDYVLANNYDAAYDMVKGAGDAESFQVYWDGIRELAEGASSYELEQIGWNVTVKNGVKTSTTAYQVYFDNDKIVLFRVVTADNVEGIAGLHVSDATEFVNRTDTVVPAFNVAVIVVSILEIAFVIWMFIDCLRRKVKVKVLWAILIFFGISVTLSLGDYSGIKFSFGIMLQTGSVAADPALLSVVTKIVVPVGAIVYFFLRKKLTVKPVQSVDGEAFQNGDASIDYIPGMSAPATSDEESTSDGTNK